MKIKSLFLLSIITTTGIIAAAQKASIGATTAVPLARLEIAGSVGTTVALFGADKAGVSINADAPGVGFNYLNNTGHQTIKAGYAALVSMDPLSGDLTFANFNENISPADFGSITGYSVRMLVKQSGNVGIGTITPAYPLTVRSSGSGNGIVQQSPDGTVQAGFWTIGGQACVQTWTNTDLNFTTGNGVSRMRLKTNGDFQIIKSVQILEKLTSAATGAANLLPLAMGKINFDGTVLRATPNIAATRLSLGKYRLTVIGESNLYANRTDYLVQVSAEGNAFAYMVNYAIQPDNTVIVELHRPRIFYTNNSCSCETFSYITNSKAQENGDGNFSFIITKF